MVCTTRFIAIKPTLTVNHARIIFLLNSARHGSSVTPLTSFFGFNDFEPAHR